MKYLFPIEEKEFKSTSIIKRENRNILSLTSEITNSSLINDKDKRKLLSLVVKTKKTIPLLTDGRLLNSETKLKIQKLTNRITWLTEDFQKVGYPPIKSIEEENKRIESLKKQTGWVKQR